MAQQFPGNAQIKTKTALVIFVKGSTAPIAIYTENPQADYKELQEVLKAPTQKLIEKDGLGPIKKVSVIANQIAAVALQEEQYAV